MGHHLSTKVKCKLKLKIEVIGPIIRFAAFKKKKKGFILSDPADFLISRFDKTFVAKIGVKLNC